MDRWRGRIAGLATAAAVAAGLTVAAMWTAGAVDSRRTGDAAAAWQLVVKNRDDRVLLRVPLPQAEVAVRYRNSVYGSIAEERFTIADGRLVLVELAADEAAVLDEYYVVGEPPRRTGAGDTRRWRAPPAVALSLVSLAVAATEHGRRTLVIDDRPPIALWPLAAAGDPTVVLTVEPAR